MPISGRACAARILSLWTIALPLASLPVTTLRVEVGIRLTPVVTR